MADTMLARHLLSDLYTYASDGMGYTLFEQPHRQMAQFFESCLPPPPALMQTVEQKYSMYLAPRETLKTSLAQGLAEYYVLKWKILYGYDARVLFIRANREASRAVLSAVKQDFSPANSIITRAFGDLSADAPKWSEDAITLPWRNVAYREPTLDTAATGVTRTGYHVDLVICDDLANENNYLSEPEMLAARTYVQALLPVMNVWGSILLLGTRWSHLDPYGWVLDKNMLSEEHGEGRLWNVEIHSSWNDDGTLFYPAYLTEKRLAQKKRVLDTKLYNANYLNVILSDESAVFQKNTQVFYQGFYVPHSDLETAKIEVTDGQWAGNSIPVTAAIHVDPATSVAATANYSGIAVVMTGPNDTRWVHQVQKVREVPSDLISRLVALCRHYEPETLSIDVLGQQVLWVDRLRDALMDAGLNIPITQYQGKVKGLGHGLIGKARRIEALEPLFREGKIFLHSGYVQPLITELDTYTGPTQRQHYDVLDALSHTLTVSYDPDPAEYAERREREELEEDDGPKQRRMVPGTWAGR